MSYWKKIASLRKTMGWAKAKEAVDRLNFLNHCSFLHVYRLVPIDSTKNSIILHANFNDKGGFDGK